MPLESSLKPRATAQKSHRLRILAVDDNPTVLKTLQLMLEEFHDFVAMTDERAALASLLEQVDNFDVIICDVGMSNRSNSELCRILTEQRSSLMQKMIFLVGDNDVLGQAHSPCVRKPFTKEELLRAITEVGVEISVA